MVKNMRFLLRFVPWYPAIPPWNDSDFLPPWWSDLKIGPVASRLTTPSRSQLPGLIHENELACCLQEIGTSYSSASTSTALPALNGPGSHADALCAEDGTHGTSQRALPFFFLIRTTGCCVHGGGGGPFWHARLIPYLDQLSSRTTDPS